MSVLGRLFSEDLLPALRRRLPGLRERRRSGTCNDVAPQSQADPPSSERKPAGGIATVLLNWRNGENDPFTYVNTAIAAHLRACGKNVEVIEITAGAWPSRVIDILRRGGIDFAYTWQGLGSSAMIGNPPVSLWDSLRVPLICIHGDHPSHMPPNHQLESRYCFHLYANADHARYSNRHFRRVRGASVIDIPQLHREEPLGARHGDYFVLAKNISDPVDMEAVWRERLDRTTFDAYMAAAEVMKIRIASATYVEIHDLLDDVLAQGRVRWHGHEPGTAEYHQYHSQLDHYARNYRSVRAVTLLREFPLQIYGRGWDRIAKAASPSHAYHPGRDMAESQHLFYTRFGIVDVSPSKGLHDRTRRAMVNQSGFLSSANLEDSFPDLERFASLFFGLAPDDLPSKCAAVMADPEEHRALAARFGELYHTRFHFRKFVATIDAYAKTAHAF